MHLCLTMGTAWLGREDPPCKWDFWAAWRVAGREATHILSASHESSDAVCHPSQPCPGFHTNPYVGGVFPVLSSQSTGSHLGSGTTVQLAGPLFDLDMVPHIPALEGRPCLALSLIPSLTTSLWRALWAACLNFWAYFSLSNMSSLV